MERYAPTHVDDLEVGDVGFYVIAGRVGGLVSLGQALIDFVNTLRGRGGEHSWFTHAFIVIGTGTDEIGPWADIIEAMPRGSVIVRLRDGDRLGRGYGWVRLPLTSEQREMIRLTGRRYLGVGYGFLDYASIALLHLGSRLFRPLVAARVKASGKLICSQLVDLKLCEAGYHVFDDGRLSQDVTPGALFRAAGAQGEVMWR